MEPLLINNYYWVLCDDGEEPSEPTWKILYIDVEMAKKISTLPYYKRFAGPILKEHYNLL